jgi:hypothetical protein
MHETWTMADVVADDAVIDALRARAHEGCSETWLASSTGRSLAFVTNGERAMVMLLRHEGDPGEHAVDPDADGDEFSDGFTLANGQDDEYPNTETVPLDEGLRIMAHIVATGSWPTGSRWVADR